MHIYLTRCQLYLIINSIVAIMDVSLALSVLFGGHAEQLQGAPSLTQIVEYLPHALLVFLVLFIGFLTLKDIIYGMRRPFLNPNTWQPLQLLDRKVLTHNTRRFRFVLPHQDQKLGLPVGQHISIRTRSPDGTQVIRPYTPTSEGNARGYVDFVIKVYPEGKMSQAMDSLKVGETMEFKGPKGLFSMEKHGSASKIGMIAGGTGITPMFQVAMAFLKDPNNTTEFSLLFANVTEEDILLREELDDLAKRFPKRFKVYYVLDKPPQSGWKGGSGFITADMIRYVACRVCIIYVCDDVVYCMQRALACTVQGDDDSSVWSPPHDGGDEESRG